MREPTTISVRVARSLRGAGRLGAALLVAFVCVYACGGRRRQPHQEWTPPPLAPSDAGTPAPDPNVSNDLEPGSIRAFGLLMPVGTTERVANDTTRIFYVQAPMPRVMRYLQRRLEITTGDIHPLGAMIRGAHIRTSSPGDRTQLDVGVRDEGDRTMVSIWDRTPAAEANPRSLDDSLRAGGIDPRTRRPLPSNNY